MARQVVICKDQEAQERCQQPHYQPVAVPDVVLNHWYVDYRVDKVQEAPHCSGFDDLCVPSPVRSFQSSLCDPSSHHGISVEEYIAA